MKRSLWLFILVGVMLLLVGAALYSACAALGHSVPVTSSSSWSSRDTAAVNLLILSVAAALCCWVTVLFAARSHHRHSRVDCPFCSHHMRIDDHACTHCGSRFA